ncbi:hypothetical protein NKJ36_00720 [Mesorhizobium sp. M0142]|uniref:hypothetical protein n=1 Tax=unclassified Mesorhizobium TaxID=325217 RepID=UPI0012EBD8E0|nr:hypothetical protein [Mesorhizobium sp. LSHC420B00]
MSPEPFGIQPIDLSALTPKQREALYSGAVRRAHQERAEAIRLSLSRVASIFKKPAGWAGAIVSFAGLMGAAAKRTIRSGDFRNGGGSAIDRTAASP